MVENIFIRLIESLLRTFAMGGNSPKWYDEVQMHQ